MQIDSSILKNEESVIYKLRALYKRHGYSYFKMSKFEEYDLYGTNKDFLVSEGVITFTDTNGKLMALKPDVTLSIVKNFRARENTVSRVYYNENVYRIKDQSSGFREIMQTGLECLGDITEYNLCEVVYLAAQSLSTISENSVLTLSHLGIVSALIGDLNLGDDRAVLLSCIDSKNTGDIEKICAKYSVEGETAALLTALATTHGTAAEVADKIKSITSREDIIAPITLLEKLALEVAALTSTKITVDLSIIGDISYYNGLVLRGFVKGLPAVILSGGQYDSLMKKMNKDAGALGFAVYLDQLELTDKKKEYDTDVLLLTTKDDLPGDILRRALEITESGLTVTVQAEIPKKLTYGRIESVKGGAKK